MVVVAATNLLDIQKKNLYTNNNQWLLAKIKSHECDCSIISVVIDEFAYINKMIIDTEIFLN